jgi:hypothetical protein
MAAERTMSLERGDRPSAIGLRVAKRFRESRIWSGTRGFTAGRSRLFAILKVAAEDLFR